MKKTLLLPVLLLTLSATGCGGTTDPSNSNPIDDKKYQCIIDNTFQKGFRVNPANGLRQDDQWFPDDRWQMDVDLTYGEHEGSDPVWLVSQHGDIYSLNDKYNGYVGGKPTYENGYYTFQDESKVMSVNPTTGSLYLELNTSAEYVRPRQSKEAWCHILLNQGFEKAVRVADVSTIDFTIDLEMKKFVDNMNGQANRDLHATQFLMYIIVKSENAFDAKDFFWFGIPFFDNRYPNGLPETGLVDAGGAGATSKFIYGMASNEYLPNGLPLNQKQSVNMDIKPHLGYALIKAQSMNYFMNSTIDDLTFQAMNIGFEIPGSYDCGIEISNFSLTANYK